MENEYTVYCSRCGAEMKSNSRYCMKCGNLNYDHEANESMKKYAQEKEQVYEIGSGRFAINNDEGNTRQTYATNTGNKIVCFILNFLLFIGIIGVSFFFCVKDSFDLKMIVHSSFPFIAIITSFFFLYFYSLQLIFMKCNKPWWAAIIPIYNVIILSQIVFNKKWIGLLTFIPIIGIIVWLIMLYKLGTYFHFNGVLVILFPFIYIPLMGFGIHVYRGYLFTNDQNWLNLEREYRLKKIYLFLLALFFTIGFISILFTNHSSIKEVGDKIRNYYYIHVSKRFVSSVKDKIKTKNYECSMEFEDTDYVYFYYTDLRKAFHVPLGFIHDVISGYVKVDKSKDKYEYYVSIGDGKKGLRETNINDIDLNTVVDYYELPSVGIENNLCEFIY